MTRDSGDGEDAAVLDYSDASATFGDRLALAREAAGLGQAQLAGRMGVRMQTLRNWEEDRSEPRANRLHILAGVLNVPMVWLMSGQGPAPLKSGPPRPAAEACLSDLRSLRAEQQQMAEKLGRLEVRLRAILD